MYQDDPISYAQVKKAMQACTLDFATLQKACLTKEECDELLALIQSMAITHEEQWHEKTKNLVMRQLEAQCSLVTDLLVYHILLNRLGKEQDEAIKAYRNKKGYLITLEVEIKSKKAGIVKLEHFKHYKELLEDYLYTQVARLNRYAPYSRKKAILENYIQDCQNIVNISQFTQLKALLPKIREVTKEHRDTNFSWRYFLKFNWLRNPASYNAFNHVFDQNNELREQKNRAHA